MALENVHGTLADFKGQFDNTIGLRIVFRPNGAAVGAGGIFYSKPVIVDTFSSDGSWSAQLQSTAALWQVVGDDVFYIVTIERLESDGDYFPVDHTGWKLRVPPGGGVFAALVEAPTNPAQMWVGPGKRPDSNNDEPVQPMIPSRYTAWYRTNTVPGLGLANYFEWE